ncbi:MAG: DUF4331 domain-containing protein [Planctomycetota bacterium]
MPPRTLLVCTLVALALLPASYALASSHREAPAIIAKPQVDGTDFYMFRSYEPGREGFVTLIANYVPLQDAYGGPNYFPLDPDALYEIHIDNDGNAEEDLTFQFRFNRQVQDIQIPVGPPGQEEMVSVPLINVGPIAAAGSGAQNVVETFTVNMVEGDRRTGTVTPISNAADGSTTFEKPLDNIGEKSIPDYDAYASAFVYDITLPGTTTPGRLFVGQRKESFVVNLGEVFDLVNFDPLAAPDSRVDDLADKNITSFALELPLSLVTNGTEPVIGGWTSASLRQARVLNSQPDFDSAKPSEISGGAWTQVSRLGSPLINELIIGLKDKDRFNASEPKDDPQFLTYLTNPTLPALLEILFPVQAPTFFPRADLVAAFLTGIDGFNQPAGVVPGEMLRLNTTFVPEPVAQQNRLGVIDGDAAGFPNGRRPGDDVVDIELRVAMGALIDPTLAPSGQLPFTDGAIVDSSFFDESFPYLRTPLPGSPATP